MKRIFLAALAVVLALGVLSIPRVVPTSSGPTVLVSIDGGPNHGSGFHIGGGLFLTAAHVAEAGEEFEVEDDLGNAFSAEFLWQNRDYDVALMYAPEASEVGQAGLSCSRPAIADEVRVEGNPQGLRFASTWGTVASNVPYTTSSSWEILVPIDVTVSGGNSGGPVYAGSSNVAVGMLVASFRDNTFALMVPGDVICRMLGRA